MKFIINFGVSMSVIRPKYSLNHYEIQGDSITIPADEYIALTTRHYPYPRVGTRAPDGMFPYTGNPGSNPGSSSLVREPHGYVRDGAIVKSIGGIRPHYTLDKTEIQGVMPASTYMDLTGKLTTAPTLPPRYAYSGGSPVVSAPALEFDWGTFFWGAILGGVVTLGFVYGVIPAMAEWGAAEIRKRY